MILRSYPTNYGFELNEFDPFFNYRATEFLLQNGIDSYFSWHDNLSWYPIGRDVSINSQVVLHFTTGFTYWLFGQNITLYDYTILFPAIIGSLTTVIVFGITRNLFGTSAGLFASLLFSISLPILIRGTFGWFKSEPLGLFFGLLATYLFLSGIFSKNLKFSVIKNFFSGIFLIFGISAWGGDYFFAVILGFFIISLPFFRSDDKYFLLKIFSFVGSFSIFSFMFERIGLSFFSGLGGYSILLPVMIIIIIYVVKSFSSKENKLRNSLIAFVLLIIFSSIFLLIGIENQFVNVPSFRYFNAMNPFLTNENPLIDSISEHATTNTTLSFLFHVNVLIFSGIGIWLLLSMKNKKTERNLTNLSFILIFCFFGVYLSSTFLRLEVFGALATIIISSITLSFFTKAFTKNKNFTRKSILQILPITLVMLILVIPIIPLGNSSIFSILDTPPTIMNGGTTFKIASNDWNDALYWIKSNTPKDSVIGSWWDYGYWIQTKSDRATLADNSTLIDSKIKKIAEIFFMAPDDAWEELNRLETDYFVIFVSGERLPMDTTNQKPAFLLGGGGDESKRYWFSKIAEQPIEKYLYSDQLSGTDLFWNETFLGKIIPFELIGYVNFNTQQLSSEYVPGWTPVYEKKVKFSSDGPFELVYSSPSYQASNSESMIGVFIYKINSDYKK